MVWGLGITFKGAGCGVHGVGCGVQGVGCEVLDLILLSSDEPTLV